MIKTLSEVDRSKTVKVKQIYADPLIKMKKYAGAYTSIGAGLDKNGYPVTGLTEDSQEPSVAGKIGKKIPGTRREMEIELDLAEGTLKQSNSYWDSYSVRMDSDDKDLVLANPHDLLQYLFLHAQSIVAVGLAQITQDSKVEYVIYSDEEEAETKVTARKSLKDAYQLSDKLDIETKINILAVYGIIVESSSTATIENKIDEKIEENPKKFLAIVQDKNLLYLSLVTKCLDKGILIMDGGAILHGEVNVGYDKESAAAAIAKDAILQAVLRAKLSGDMDLIQKALLKAKVVDAK